MWVTQRQLARAMEGVSDRIKTGGGFHQCCGVCGIVGHASEMADVIIKVGEPDAWWNRDWIHKACIAGSKYERRKAEAVTCAHEFETDILEPPDYMLPLKVACKKCGEIWTVRWLPAKPTEHAPEGP